VTSLEQLVGERTVPLLEPENYWFRRHQAAYLTLAPLIVAAATRTAAATGTAVGTTGSVLLEAGSGEGYGVQLLNQAGAERVVALDYDAAALAHAGGAYPRAVRGRAVRANLVRLPLADASVDAITSLQVIEHLWTPDEFLVECARVLRPGGLLVLSTPNRPTFSPGLGRGEKPANPFHFREFDAAELDDLIAGPLAVTDRLALVHGPRLTAWQHRHGDLVRAQLDRPPAQWPGELVALVASITADDFVLTPARDCAPAEVLDLIVLAGRR
jgi:SAM-dependent methyltransferase